MEALTNRHRGKKEIVDELRSTVKERIDRGEIMETGDESYEPASTRVEKDFAGGILNEKHLERVLAKNDNTYVRFALVKVSGFQSEETSKMVRNGIGKAIVSLSWKAGLTIAMAVKLQTHIGRVKRGSLLRGDANRNYPLTADEMDWYLESFL